MAVTLSPNMGLLIPSVGSQPGPDYAENVNSSLTLVDMHDHSLGSGVQITPAGLNINANLSFQENSAISLASLVLTAQSSITTPLAVYSKPGTESPPINDLWFNDGSGTPVQITSNGLVNATATSIPGESFSGGTFFWKQGSGSTTPANFDIGSITIRPNTAATTFGVTLSPPGSISSAYTLTLPTDPGSLSATSFLTLTSGGVIAASVSTNQGITSSMIADGAISTAKLAFNPSIKSQIFLSSNSWTAPADVTKVMIIAQGGGGGGGGGGSYDGGTQAGGGGGGGGASERGIAIVDVTPGVAYAIIIGGGGAGGAISVGTNTNGSAGSDGSSTSFASLAIFVGGAGGRGGPGGQTATTGLLPQPGIGATGSGGNGAYADGTLSQVAQRGKNSSFAAGGIPAGNGSGRAGGGGGAGLSSGGAGGAGGNPGAAPAAAAANSGSGGGGGGGSDGATPRAGAAGGSGYLVVAWTGNS